MTRGDRAPTRGVAAHRGGPEHAPENTLAAFGCALAAGAHQIELDLRQTRDAAIVVMHDAEVDRTTDGVGRVADLSLPEVQRLDASDGRFELFAGERVPTLEQTLDMMPTDVWINLQIKYGEPLAGRVAALVRDRGRVGQVLLACGNAAAREARAVVPEIQICNLVRQQSRDAYVSHAAATGANFIQLHHLRGPAEPEIVARAHAAGMRVNFFCDPGVSESELDALFSAGIDFVLVDDVVQALRVAKRFGVEPVVRS